jgi:putative redox protein
MVKIQIEYQGDLHCKAVHVPSGRELETDAPVDNHGRGESFSPTDLLAASLGVCMITIMGIAARKQDVELKGTAIHVEKHMSADLPRRISKLVVNLDMCPGIPADKRGVLEEAGLNCPVMKSIHPDIDVAHYFKYPD